VGATDTPTRRCQTASLWDRIVAVLSPLYRPLILFVFISCAAAGGCGVNWVVVGRQAPFEFKDEQRMKAADDLRLRLGRTSHSEVRQIMGAPDYQTEDGSFTAYYWDVSEVREGVRPWQWRRPKTLAEHGRYFLLMQFDSRDVLTRYERRRVAGSTDPGCIVSATASRWGIDSCMTAHSEVAVANSAPATQSDRSEHPRR